MFNYLFLFLVKSKVSKSNSILSKFGVTFDVNIKNNQFVIMKETLYKNEVDVSFFDSYFDAIAYLDFNSAKSDIENISLNQEQEVVKTLKKILAYKEKNYFQFVQHNFNRLLNLIKNNKEEYEKYLKMKETTLNGLK